MGFLLKMIGASLFVLLAIYGIWWVFVKYSILTIFSFTFIVISILVLSGLGVSLMAKVGDN